MAGQVRILIVDDEPAVRTALRLAARRQPWQVEEVDSAEDALKRLGEDRFDAALIDKNLPGITGVELIQEIRKTDQSMAIIMITGYASAESATEALQLGIDAYLEKPFSSVYDVVKRIDDALGAHRDQRHTGRLAAANEHFCRAVDTLRGRSVKKSGWGQLRILLVSPVENERAWLAEQLQSSATEVAQVSSSSEAVRHYGASQAPHLVMVDTSVQEPDVVQFIREMKERVPEAGFVVVADKSPLHLGLVTSLIDLNVRVILDKPLDAMTLRRKLEYVVGKIRQAGTAQGAEGTV